MSNLNNQESIIKLNKKNYTLWRLEAQKELEKRKLFGLIVNDHSSRERSYSNQWDNYNYSKQVLRNKKQDALDFLLSILSNEIQEEVREFDKPNKVWNYLETKYSLNSIKRLDCAMNELKNIKFNFENYDLFIDKFKKIVHKINDCGLELEDNYLNFYLLASLIRSKRINNSNEFHKFLNSNFNDFINKLRDHIIDPPDGLELRDHYSDVSNESFNYDLSDDQQIDDKKKNLNDLNDKIDFNLMKYNMNVDKLNDNKLSDNKISDNKLSDNQIELLNNFTDNNELNAKNLNSSRRSNAFPILFSPIKKEDSTADQINNQLEIENENDTPNKIYEDLNPTTSDFEYSTCKEEKSYSFISASENDIKIQDLSGDQLNLSIKPSTSSKDDHQINLNKQQQTDNSSDIKMDTNSNSSFYIDKNGSF